MKALTGPRQLALPDLAAKSETAPTGTCRVCQRRQRVFLYDRRAPAPWWYLVWHAHPLGLGWCPGGGFPAVEQVQP